MTRIVCQAADKPGRITLVWSAGGASFEPLHIEGGELSELRNVAASVRQRLAAGSDPNELGRRLFALLFPGPLGAEIAGWLRDLDGRGEIESLEVASDAPGEIPWTAVDDPQRPGAWGRRFNLSGGHRVHPLRSFPDLVDPKLLAVLHPGLDPAVTDEVLASLASRQMLVVRTREELLARLDTELPDVVWIVAPASDVGWRLGAVDLRADDLARAFAKEVSGNPYPCPLVVSSAFGESNVSAVREAIPGLVTSELPLAERPALALGRAFLEAFVDGKKPLGAALRQVRERMPGPMSLAWTGYAPPQVGIRSPDDESAAPKVAVHPLPAEPFHPLRPLEREDRALLLGRDRDIFACAETLDRADASALWIHGKASVGKASLLRAGLVPFLEEETGGFVAWRERTEVEGPETETAQPTISARVGRDLAGSIAQGLLVFCARPMQFRTPTGRTFTVDLPELLSEFAPVLSSAIREGAEPEKPGASPEPASTRDAIRSLCFKINADPAILNGILERITRPLPFELVLAFEQGDDLVALPRLGDFDPNAADRRTVAGRLLDVLGRTSARVKSIVTVRTEFFAQVQDVMLDPSARQAWQDHYLPEVDEETLSDILIAATTGEPLAYSNQVPASAYEFGFEPKVVDDLLAKIKKTAKAGGVSRLTLVHTVGAEIFDESRRRSRSAVRLADVKKMKLDRAVSDLVSRKLREIRCASRSVTDLFERLMVRHDSGVRTRNLLSLRSIEEKWKGSKPARTVVDQLYEARLIDMQAIVQDGAEAYYVGPPQDSFELLEAGRETAASSRSSARSKVLDTLFIMIPLALLGIAITRWWTVRQYAQYIAPDKIDDIREQIKIIDVGMKATQLSAYHGLIGRAEEALERGDTLRARQLLLAGIPDRDEADLRGFEWYLLWRKSQMETKSLHGHTAGVRVVALGGENEVLASGDEVGTVNLWNLKKGDELGATLVGLKRPVQALAISADGAWVAGSDGGNEVLVWPTTLGDERPAETTPKSRVDVKNARAIAFVAPGILAAAADDGVILWDVAAGKEKAKLKELAAPALGLVPLEGGKFATASADEAIVWSADGKKESAVKFRDATIHAMTAAKSGLLLAGAKNGPMEEGVVYVWDLKDGSTPIAKARQPGPVRAVANLGDDRIATGGDDMTIRVHDLAAGVEIGRLYGHLSRVRAMVAGKGGLLLSAGFDPVVKVWNAGKTSPFRDSIPAHDSVQALALDPTGQLLASGGRDGQIKLWNMRTTELTGEIKAAGPVQALAFAPGIVDKSATLAAAVGNDVLRWTLSTEKYDVKDLPPLKKHTDRVLCLHYSPDGKQIVSAGRDKSAILWDLKTEKALKTFTSPAAITAIDCPIPYVVGGDENGWVRIWSSDTGQEFQPHRPHGLAVTGIDVLRQKGLSLYVTASLDQSTRWSVQQTGQEGIEVVANARGFAEPITGFVQGTGFVAMAGAGGSVAIVDITIDEPRFVFRAHPGPINAIALSRSQAVLVTGGADGTIRFFRSEPLPDYGPVKLRLFPPPRRKQQVPDDDS